MTRFLPALLILVMWVGAPMCMYDALARGQVVLVNPNNEEHKDSEGPETPSEVARRSVPPPPRPPTTVVEKRRIAIAHWSAPPPAAAPVVHPSRFSERRLI